jgi:hypothetical protein
MKFRAVQQENLVLGSTVIEKTVEEHNMTPVAPSQRSPPGKKSIFIIQVQPIGKMKG